MVAATLCAAVIVVAWFPARELVRQHEELSAANSQLSLIAQRNASLSADISALSAKSTIAAIAHEEYGLERRGQTSYVILPAAGSSATDGELDPDVRCQGSARHRQRDELEGRTLPSRLQRIQCPGYRTSGFLTRLRSCVNTESQAPQQKRRAQRTTPSAQQTRSAIQ